MAKMPWQRVVTESMLNADVFGEIAMLAQSRGLQAGEPERGRLTDEIMVRTRPSSGVRSMINRAAVFAEETHKPFCEIHGIRHYAAARYAVSGPDRRTGRSVRNSCRPWLAAMLRSDRR